MSNYTAKLSLLQVALGKIPLLVTGWVDSGFIFAIDWNEWHRIQIDG